jgi:hypothetical protein
MSYTSGAIVAQGTTLARTFTSSSVSATADNSDAKFVRASGSWVTDGVKVGMTFTTTVVGNTTATYTITAVSATDLTVTPAPTDLTPAASANFIFLVPCGEITSIDGPGGSNSEIDVTSMDSTSKEWRNGLRDSGEVSLELNFVPGNVGQVDLRLQQAELNTPGDYVLTLSNNTEISFSAFVRDFRISGAVDDKISASCTLRVTGDVTWSDMD